MTSQGFSRPGAIDLSGFAKPAAGRPGAPGGAPAASAAPGSGPGGTTYAVDVTDATFEQQVLNQSLSVPVVLVFWSGASTASVQVRDMLARLSADYDGRLQVAMVDVAANPQLAASAGAQQLPVVLGVLRGQALPLFAEPVPEPQARQVLDELLKVAVSNGVSGRAEPAGGPPGAAEVPAEPPHDPRYDEAYDAIDRGDLDAAAAAYAGILADAPADADADAKAGLSQVELLRRTQGLDPVSARADAAAKPDDVDAQVAAADLDLLDGRVEDGFGRLVDLVARTSGADRDRARTHLLDLFEVVGGADPRVVKARAALARVLF